MQVSLSQQVEKVYKSHVAENTILALMKVQMKFCTNCKHGKENKDVSLCGVLTKKGEYIKKRDSQRNQNGKCSLYEAIQ